MGGVLQLTRVLDLGWARHGITVNAIGTGWMSETAKTEAPQEDLPMEYLPSRRNDHPKESGSLVICMVSDATDFFSGQLTA
jgi:gluconate 5-dehydrogenase